MLSLEQLLGKNKEVMRRLGGLRQRPGQDEMLAAVSSAVVSSDQIIVHAPTGTGKSLAYLIPVVEAGKKVIVATATKMLQAQLTEHDLPNLARAIPGLKTATIMGRNNYLCKIALDDLSKENGTLFPDEAMLAQGLHELTQWAETTQTGSIHDAPATAMPLWSRASVSGEECVGINCPAYDMCFANKAMIATHSAQVIVTNHHLLLTDAQLRPLFGQGDRLPMALLLPHADVLVVDEGHRLHDVAADAFGAKVTSVRVTRTGEAIDRARKAWKLEAKGASERLTNLFLGAVGDLPLQTLLSDDQGVGEALRQLSAEVIEAKSLLPREHDPKDVGTEIARKRINRLGADLEACGAGMDNRALWIEEDRRKPVLRAAHLAPGPILHDLVWSRFRTVVVCSATLAVDGKLTRAKTDLGLQKSAIELIVKSPFDFKAHSVLFVPDNDTIPLPNDPSFLARSAKVVVELVAASRGRALVLCTSWAAVEVYRQALSELSFAVFAQGDAPTPRLIEAFRDDVSSVLVATRGFYEGVDVPGEALSLVVIDRIPFQTPNDVLMNARQKRVKERGGNGFGEIQIPAAAIHLQQAFGRLLRSELDVGVVAILDRRIVEKGYGKPLLASLPPSQRTQRLDWAVDWLEAIPTIAEAEAV